MADDIIKSYNVSVVVASLGLSRYVAGCKSLISHESNSLADRSIKTALVQCSSHLSAKSPA